MRGEYQSNNEYPQPLDTRPERAPGGAGVILAVLAGMLCWTGLFVVFI